MQGDANRVDLSRMARRAIKRRVQTTFKVKGYNSDYDVIMELTSIQFQMK